MSRRKQDKPQPRKQLLEVDECGLQDTLTCGGCNKDFCLSEIVQFIAHKVQSCNKENYEMGFDLSPARAPTTPISARLGSSKGSKPPLVATNGEKPRALVDADTNTTETEPCNYICCTCKQTETSAWALLQHVQNVHGIKIYVDANSRPPPAAPTVNGSDSSQPLTVDTSPQFPLLRMPLGERQFGTPLNAHNFFPRPPPDFRMDLLADQFHRINHHHAPLAISPFDPHHAFERTNFERSARTSSTTPQLSLSFEPQIDFYSQRLRQLAGATSPNPTQSPRKLTPPFSQSSTVCSRPSSTPSTPTPQPTLSQQSKAQPSSCSSTSSKLSEQQGSPKLKSCEFCGKSFRFQSNLEVHRRSHTGEKPYKCHICNHSCSQSSKLKRHMKTHKSSGNGSENNSLLSPRSTPESDTAKDNDIDDSDGQTADNEEEEEEDFEDEDDMLEEDDDLNNEMNNEMMAEDLSTRSINSSTPNTCNNNTNNHQNNNNNISREKNETKQSILGEVMENIGLNNIQQYTEAYHQALEESTVPKTAVKIEKSTVDSENNASLSSVGKASLENGPNKEDNNIGQVPSVGPLEFGHGMLGSFDHPFDPGSKRLKIDVGLERGDGLYAGIWRPATQRDLLLGTNDKTSAATESAFKSALSLVSTTRPGPSATTLLTTSPGVPNKIKTDRRNDTCEYCGKIFKNCSNLTVHRRSHTGEKPYKCGLCSYACAQSSKLTRHMKTHGRMGKDVYRCRFCDMPFSVPSTLEKHMRKCVVHQNVVGMLADKDSDSKETT